MSEIFVNFQFSNIKYLSAILQLVNKISLFQLISVCHENSNLIAAEVTQVFAIYVLLQDVQTNSFCFFATIVLSGPEVYSSVVECWTVSYYLVGLLQSNKTI